MLTIGDQTPSFSLASSQKQPFTQRDLLDANTILYFYPQDDTPGCTVEAKDFSDLLSEFDQLNTKIIGISPDDIVSHNDFIHKQQLAINLIADPEKELITAFGVWGEKKNYGKIYHGLIRSTFLLNMQGEIIAEWRNVRAKGHAARILKEIKKILS